jgi:hypothetical protein
MPSIWCAKLGLCYNEAHKEKNITVDKINQSYAIFPKSFYKKINTYYLKNPKKKYNFCFIGGLKTDRLTSRNRSWIIPFAKRYFTRKSYLQFTDRKTKRIYIKKGIKRLGKYDYTLFKNGFVPKEVKLKENRNFFDENYFSTLSKSNFCLCPGGDAPWSMRFYEAIMCKAIPIVHKAEESYRTEAEKNLGYKFYLTSDKNFIYRKDWSRHNYNLFLKYHTLEFINENASNEIQTDTSNEIQTDASNEIQTVSMKN